MHGTWVLIIMLVFSSFPVIAVFIWYRISKYPISPVKFLLTLLIGATAIFPAIVLKYFLPSYNPINTRIELFYNFFFYGAFTEEISRMLFLFIFFLIIGLFKNKDDNNLLSWNTVKTGAALGLVAGLGFAILENSIYAAGRMSLSLLLLRAFTAAPLHAACGSRVGAAAVMFLSNPVQSVFRLLAAIAIHGIYNLLLEISAVPENTPAPIFIISILIAYSALVTAILSIKGSWNER